MLGPPCVRPGACGKDARGPGRHPADGPQSGPEVEGGGREAGGTHRRPGGSHPGAKGHGGQAAAIGVMGSRTLSPAEIGSSPEASSAPERQQRGDRATLTADNSTLTLE
ncbi:hypothetical protein GCM10022384_31370 [Streptomyces marokkonensis]|uniref:Uncharacterized protein n=1 Tax=Streptomyces marokkonensis TaxID=324855 RepID=A0ABP7QEB9_9ACTN